MRMFSRVVIFIFMFILQLELVTSNRCPTECVWSSWGPWRCDSCCQVWSLPNSAYRYRAICCSAEPDIDSCLRKCHYYKNQTTDYGPCVDHCPCGTQPQTKPPMRWPPKMGVTPPLHPPVPTVLRRTSTAAPPLPTISLRTSTAAPALPTINGRTSTAAPALPLIPGRTSTAAPTIPTTTVAPTTTAAPHTAITTKSQSLKTTAMTATKTTAMDTATTALSTSTKATSTAKSAPITTTTRRVRVSIATSPPIAMSLGSKTPPGYSNSQTIRGQKVTKTTRTTTTDRTTATQRYTAAATQPPIAIGTGSKLSPAINLANNPGSSTPSLVKDASSLVFHLVEVVDGNVTSDRVLSRQTEAGESSGSVACLQDCKGSDDLYNCLVKCILRPCEKMVQIAGPCLFLLGVMVGSTITCFITRMINKKRDKAKESSVSPLIKRALNF